jgi:hypothetical protein
MRACRRLPRHAFLPTSILQSYRNLGQRDQKYVVRRSSYGLTATQLTIFEECQTRSLVALVDIGSAQFILIEAPRSSLPQVPWLALA